MKLILNDKQTVNMTTEQAAQEINDYTGLKTVKILINPNNTSECKIYIDDLHFCIGTSYYDMEKNDYPELLGLIKAPIKFYAVHEEWDNIEAWTTSRMAYHYLQYEEETDKWYQYESEEYKEHITWQYNQIQKCQHLLEHIVEDLKGVFCDDETGDEVEVTHSYYTGIDRIRVTCVDRQKLQRMVKSIMNDYRLGMHHRSWGWTCCDIYVFSGMDMQRIF